MDNISPIAGAGLPGGTHLNRVGRVSRTEKGVALVYEHLELPAKMNPGGGPGGSPWRQGHPEGSLAGIMVEISSGKTPI